MREHLALHSQRLMEVAHASFLQAADLVSADGRSCSTVRPDTIGAVMPGTSVYAALARESEGRDMPFGPLLVAFGRVREHGLKRFGRLLFDWFRVPVLEVSLNPGGRIERIRPVPPNTLKGEARDFFLESLDAHTGRAWTAQKDRVPARWSLALPLLPWGVFSDGRSTVESAMTQLDGLLFSTATLINISKFSSLLSPFPTFPGLILYLSSFSAHDLLFDSSL